MTVESFEPPLVMARLGTTPESHPHLWETIPWIPEKDEWYNDEFMSDEYTIAMRLCDNAGMVSHESVDEDRDIALADPKLTYLDRLNFLRNLTRIAQGSKPETIDEPFTCTGHAHLAGEHIRCTSSAHQSKSNLTGHGSDGEGQ